ncbi:Myosin type-2 heavy chain 1 [Yarrowia sp. C11]|nr:Myosin type-2 heavy chain 1 [Yarrowia sp. C11]KAG5364523.1 Myosin type-2 heavy chain 1 [Yarrowia sp. E02]
MTNNLEAENAEFAAKKWVWVADPQLGFIKGFVVSEDGDKYTVNCGDENRVIKIDDTDKVNPPKFNMASDMAELTFLSEAAVIANLASRYKSDMIYTYSGLFLVAINPYRSLPIYDKDTIRSYRNKHRDEVPPHIFAITDLAFQNMIEAHENQSILVTGESGAGKTENTKKVIQYLAAVAQEGKHASANDSTFEDKILQANPILEAFGNAQTVRNNNSSRFGKFIRIEFERAGAIAGAVIDWYLLEKSRVISQNSSERNYHVFYQLLSGASEELREKLLIKDSVNPADHSYLKGSNHEIPGVNDKAEFGVLQKSFQIMGFTEKEQHSIFQTLSAILHLGNIELAGEGSRASGVNQARLVDISQAERLCHLLGISTQQFVTSLLHPKVKAGREWVQQNRSTEQVRFSLDSLAKSLYERTFGFIVDRINACLQSGASDTTFIGVLDIAGFEIFQVNSFEQLCINYTNERLQQFFNHHMFVLEQEEYARENIEWKYVDFGHDLQPTIDLIEKPNPIGIFSCLDEDCVMPKASDKTFTEKLHQLWDKKSPKYKSSRLKQGFVLTHYAADVEYSTEGWLDKNKDPLNANVIELLVESSDSHVRCLFQEEAKEAARETSARSKGGKKGIFRTVAQKHKEQLNSLMTRLQATHPHFVRCIIPNHKKQPQSLDSLLVLDQLRCNGVLEGIRIARSGFPNRLPFSDFKSRYQVLVPMPQGFMDGQKACQHILSGLKMDTNLYRVGLTKVFFKSGVLAELEEQRESCVREVIVRFQSLARGCMTRRKFLKAQHRHEAAQIIKKNLSVYTGLKDNKWWKLYVKMRPLLATSKDIVERRAKDAEVKRLEKKMADIVETRDGLDERCRKAESELAKIEEKLTSERATAADKDEILRRSQEKEAELSAQLDEAYEDLDQLETQMEELLAAKKRADEQTDTLKKELDNGAKLLSKLESEKADLAASMAAIEKELAEATEKHSNGLSESESLNEQLSMIRNCVAMREAKIEELEGRLEESEKELGSRLAAATSGFDSANRRIRELIRENKEVRDQLADLHATSFGYEKLVRKKEQEQAVLKADIDRHVKDLEDISRQKHSLETKQESVSAELAAANEEIKTLSANHEQLKQELEKRRQESESEEKQKAAQMMLETEALKEELAKERRKRTVAESEVSKTQNDLSRVKKEFSAKSSEVEGLQKSKQSAEKEAARLQSQVEKAQAAQSAAERALSKLVADLKVAREEAAHLTRQDKSREQSLKSQVENLRNESAKHRSLNETLTADAGAFKTRLDSLLAEKKTLTAQVATLTSAAGADKDQLAVLREAIDVKNNQLTKLRNQVEAETQARLAHVSQSSQAKQVSDDQVASLKRKLSELETVHSTGEKQRERMAREIEDLKHHNTQDHKSALSQERLVTELKAALEKERRERSETAVLRRKLQSQVDSLTETVELRTSQVTALNRAVLGPNKPLPSDPESLERAISSTVDLATRLEESERRCKALQDGKQLAEEQFRSAKQRWSADTDSLTTRRSHEDINLTSYTSPSKTKRPLSVSAVSHLNRDATNGMDVKLKDKLATAELALSQALAKNKLLAKEAEEARSRSFVSSRDMSPERPSSKASNSSKPDMNFQLEAERSRNRDLQEDLQLYRQRAEEYYGKIESAEIAILKSSRAEEFAKQRCEEAESERSQLLAERQQAETALIELQAEVRGLENQLEDKEMEMATLRRSHKRLETEQGRGIEGSKSELAELTKTLAAETKNVSTLRHENMMLQQASDAMKRQRELERSEVKQWRDDHDRLAAQMHDLQQQAQADEKANSEAQKRVASLLSQVQNLRTTMDEITTDRDQLLKDKRALETRVSTMAVDLEGLLKSHDEAPLSRSASQVSPTQLRSAEKSAADALATLERERKVMQLQKQESEKQAKELNLKVLDLESRLMTSGGGDTETLRKRVTQLEKELEEQQSEMLADLKSSRGGDRQARELRDQLDQRDQLVKRLQEESAKSEAKVSRLVAAVEKAQGSESQYQVVARRAERESRELREKSLRLEKDLENWKSRLEAYVSNNSNFEPSFV